MRAFDVIEKFCDQKHQKSISVRQVKEVKGWWGTTSSETNTNLLCGDPILNKFSAEIVLKLQSRFFQQNQQYFALAEL